MLEETSTWSVSVEAESWSTLWVETMHQDCMLVIVFSNIAIPYDLHVGMVMQKKAKGNHFDL